MVLPGRPPVVGPGSRGHRAAARRGVRPASGRCRRSARRDGLEPGRPAFLSGVASWGRSSPKARPQRAAARPGSRHPAAATPPPRHPTRVTPAPVSAGSGVRGSGRRTYVAPQPVSTRPRTAALARVQGRGAAGGLSDPPSRPETTRRLLLLRGALVGTLVPARQRPAAPGLPGTGASELQSCRGRSARGRRPQVAGWSCGAGGTSPSDGLRGGGENASFAVNGATTCCLRRLSGDAGSCPGAPARGRRGGHLGTRPAPRRRACRLLSAAPELWAGAQLTPGSLAGVSGRNPPC